MTLGTFSANYPASAIGYSDYTGLATIGLTAGAPYSLTVQNNPQWSSTVEAWIDFDDDSIFTLAEKLGTLNLTAGATGTIVFTVPPNAVNDTVRMRLMGVFPSNAGPLDPCGTTFGFGETEDYNVLIFPPPPEDAGVTSITPLSTICGFSANEPININVLNYGMMAQDTIPVSYSINGGTPVVDTIFGNLASGATVNFTFAQGADLSTPNTTYTILVWTDLAGDANATNDTASLIVINPVVLLSGGQSYFEDFETLILTRLLMVWQIAGHLLLLILCWMEPGI
ncbi:MAG: GEVED domain-containing protein [Bacteroidia bacterium]